MTKIKKINKSTDYDMVIISTFKTRLTPSRLRRPLRNASRTNASLMAKKCNGNNPNFSQSETSLAYKNST